MTRPHPHLPAGAALLLALLAALPATAQAGASPWSSYKRFSFDTVSRATLNVSFAVPIFSRTTVGAAQVGLVLAYGSSGWQLLQPSGWISTQTYTWGTCGWYDPGTGVDDDTGAPDDGSGTVYETSYSFTEPDGSQAPTLYWDSVDLGDRIDYWKGPADNDCPKNDPPVDEIVPDGKGYQILIDQYGGASAYDRHGDEIDGEFLDRNGNAVRTVTSGNVTTYTDPLGQALTATTTGSPATQVAYSYTGANGPAVTVTETLTATQVNTGGCGTAQYVSQNLPTQLSYPDGTSYQFEYDSTGRVNQVTLPTGGVVHYTYTLNCPQDASLAGLERWDTVNGSGAAWNWTRTENSGGASTTVETDPSAQHNDGVYSFGAPLQAGEDGPLTAAAFYSGSHTSGTLVKSLAVAVTSGSGGVSEQDVTTTLPAPAGGSVLVSETTQVFDQFGMRTTATDYDWGPGAPGSELRQVQQTLTATDGGLDDQLGSVVVNDVHGQVAQTTYGYDAKGNLLTEDDYVTTSTYLTKSFTYNANGTVATSTGVNGAVATYTYGTASCGGLFPTLVQSPVTAVKTTMTWNCTGGVMLTSADGNSESTTITYADPHGLWRPSSVTAPDGSVTNLTYTADSVERAMVFNSNASTSDALATLDGLGRPVTAQRKQAPGATNYDTVSTFYDAMDRPVRVTMPCSVAAGVGCADAAPETVTSYDALSRPLAVTDGGGGTVNYTYNQNDVLSAVGPAPRNENLKQKQEEFDGLGRLTSVCEITSTANGGGTCAQTNGVTGYWTRYTRNGGGQITGVTQNAQGSPSETRSFGFDELGRMLSETNPETGTTSYYFDSACSLVSAGDLAERVDAAGNATCYAHDALHRVTQITYPAGPNASVTPTKTFVYDAATVDGKAMANAAGRLAEAYTGSRITDLGFSYTALGQIAITYQSSPNSAGWYVSSESYYPNGAQQALNIPSVPGLTYGLDAEGRLSTVSAASGQNPITAASYSALGLTAMTLGSGDSDAYSYDNNTGRMTKYQLTVGGSTATGTVGWNTNGTRSSLGIADPIPGATDNGISCAYSHDDLGRLLEANCGGAYDEKFTWDAFGNHNSANTPSGLVTSFSFSGNRIAAANYDSNGNLLADPLLPGQTNAFDAEGHAITLEGVGVNYDALGRAVEAGGHEFVYGPGGGKMAVMSGQSLVRADIPLPGGGDAVYNASGLQYYRHADGLGSAVLSSTPSQTLASSTHYTPFGFDDTGAGAGYRSFTGQKQDIDSLHTGGQYDFLMREYNPIQGRWWTPDPAGLAAVDPNNPQSWNRFAYVNGTPLEAVDALGLHAQACMTDNCSWSDTGCTVDGMDVGCDMVNDWMNVGGGGGGMVQCPNNNCDGLRAVEGFGGSTIWEDSTQPPLDLSGPPSADGCEDTVINAVNQQFGTSRGELTVDRAAVDSGGEYNVTLTATSSSGLTPQQFNSIQQGRYASLVTMLTGIGTALHITGATGLDPNAEFSNANYGGNLSVTFTAHIDTGYAYNPIGALVHLASDVLNPGSRQPCQ